MIEIRIAGENLEQLKADILRLSAAWANETDLGTENEETVDIESLIHLIKNKSPIGEPQRGNAPVTAGMIANSFVPLENEDDRAAYILMHPKEFNDLRLYNNNLLDMESRRAYLAQGQMGMLWGAAVLTTHFIPSGAFFIVNEEKTRYVRVDVNRG